MRWKGNKMPTEPKNCINTLLYLLSILEIKSAKQVLVNRNVLKNISGVLKDLYSPNEIRKLVYATNPLLTMLPKSDFSGKYFPKYKEYK